MLPRCGEHLGVPNVDRFGLAISICLWENNGRVESHCSMRDD